MNPNDLGNMAYYDTFSGLVPCKVTGYNSHTRMVEFIVTASRKAHKKGEKLTAIDTYVVPRKMIHTRNGQYYIRPWYAWVNGVDKVYAILTHK